MPNKPHKTACTSVLQLLRTSHTPSNIHLSRMRNPVSFSVQILPMYSYISQHIFRLIQHICLLERAQKLQVLPSQGEIDANYRKVFSITIPFLNHTNCLVHLKSAFAILEEKHSSYQQCLNLQTSKLLAYWTCYFFSAQYCLNSLNTFSKCHLHANATFTLLPVVLPEMVHN